MVKRIITSIVAICVMIPCLLLADTLVFSGAVAVVSVIALYELFMCLGFGRKLYLTLPLYAAAVAFPFLMRLLPTRTTVAMIAFLCAVLYLLYVFVLVVTSHGNLSYADALVAFTMALYVLTALNAIIYIHDFTEMGRHLYLLVFIGAWVTDTFAYFCGVLLGKHKLIPDVSPKKTVEGSLGGILFCILGFVVFGIIVKSFFGGNPNFVFLAVSGLIISVISQVGDLIMSVIKRHYGIKDFGKIFPGHGGVLDRFDSILSVSLGLCAICVFSVLTGIALI